MKKPIRILCTTPKAFVGVSSVFMHLSSIGLADFVSLEELNLEIVNKYDLIIFGAWDNLYLQYILNAKCKKALLLTSAIAQVEMSPSMIELAYLKNILKLLDDKKLDYIFVGDKNLYEVIKKDKIYWFPYPIDINAYNSVVGNNKILNSVGLFCPTHHRKNMLNQLFAVKLARLVKAEVHMHTNAKLKMLGDYTFYTWLNRDAYLDLISKIYLNLNVFHSESFCYSTVDSIGAGTLPLVSPCVQKNLGLPDEITINNPDSAIDIAHKILHLIKLRPNDYNRLLALCMKSITKLKINNDKELINLFNSI